MKKIEVTILEVGDVVKLKSGSPLMTVIQACDECQMVRCVWMVDGKPSVMDFPMAAVTLDK